MEIEACSIDKDCDRPCRRKNIWKSPNWFGGWIDGTLKDCLDFVPMKEMTLSFMKNIAGKK